MAHPKKRPIHVYLENPLKLDLYTPQITPWICPFNYKGEPAVFFFVLRSEYRTDKILTKSTPESVRYFFPSVTLIHLWLLRNIQTCENFITSCTQLTGVLSLTYIIQWCSFILVYQNGSDTIFPYTVNLHCVFSSVTLLHCDAIVLFYPFYVSFKNLLYKKSPYFGALSSCSECF